MRMILAMLAFTVLGVAMAPDSANAEITYPWCAQYGTRGGARNCGFSTWEQCRAAIRGNGGYCEQNPMYQPGNPAAPRKSRRYG